MNVFSGVFWKCIFMFLLLIHSEPLHSAEKTNILQKLMDNNDDIIKQISLLINKKERDPSQLFKEITLDGKEKISLIIRDKLQPERIDQKKIFLLYKMSKRLSQKIMELRTVKKSQSVDKFVKISSLLDYKRIWQNSHITEEGKMAKEEDSKRDILQFSTNKALNAGNTLISLYLQMQNYKTTLWDEKKKIFIKLVNLLNQIMSLRLELFKLYLKISHLQSSLNRDMDNLAFINHEILIKKNNKMTKYIDKYFNIHGDIIERENSLFLMTGKNIGYIFSFDINHQDSIFSDKSKNSNKKSKNCNEKSHLSYEEAIKIIKNQYAIANASKNQEKYIFDILDCNLKKNLRIENVSQILASLIAMINYDIKWEWTTDLISQPNQKSFSVSKELSLSLQNMAETISSIVNNHWDYKKKIHEIQDRCKNLFIELSKEITSMDNNEQRLHNIHSQWALYKKQKEQDDGRFNGGLISKEKQQSSMIKFLNKQIEQIIRENEIIKNQLIIVFLTKNILRKGR